MPQTLFDKIWDAHLVAQRADGRDLIYIDRHVLHELHAPHAFETAREAAPAGAAARPDLLDAGSHRRHQARARRHHQSSRCRLPRAPCARAARKNNIRVFDLGDPEQGISHVVAPELGMVLPGATHAVPDSHASTVGGLGALAFGCGTTELAHILATQVMAMKRPKSMRIRLDGRLAPHVTAKDVALRIIAEIGVAGARGHVVEYAGDAVRAMPIEQRMTLCNLNIEMGGRSGFVAPDDATFAMDRRPALCAAGRAVGPRARALAHARERRRREFDREVVLDCGTLEPQITWGTDPSQVLGISGRVPDPGRCRAEPARARSRARSPTWGCSPACALAGLPVNRVFIGSCTNARLPDLQAAAAVVRGRQRRRRASSPWWCRAPRRVKREAEADGPRPGVPRRRLLLGRIRLLDVRRRQRRPRRAGRALRLHHQPQFREPPGHRSVRTHLVSPATAAATAIAGRIADVRQLLEEAR